MAWQQLVAKFGLIAPWANGVGFWRSGGRDRDPRPVVAPQSCADDPRRQLSAAREAAQRTAAKDLADAGDCAGMTLVPTCPRVAPCSPPSSTLRAGYAGGLRPCLTAPARDALGTSGRD